MEQAFFVLYLLPVIMFSILFSIFKVVLLCLELSWDVLWLTADRWGVSGRVWLFLQTAMSGFLFNASVVSHLFFLNSACQFSF